MYRCLPFWWSVVGLDISRPATDRVALQSAPLSVWQRVPIRREAKVGLLLARPENKALTLGAKDLSDVFTSSRVWTINEEIGSAVAVTFQVVVLYAILCLIYRDPPRESRFRALFTKPLHGPDALPGLLIRPHTDICGKNADTFRVAGDETSRPKCNSRVRYLLAMTARAKSCVVLVKCSRAMFGGF